MKKLLLLLLFTVLGIQGTNAKDQNHDDVPPEEIRNWFQQLSNTAHNLEMPKTNPQQKPIKTSAPMVRMALKTESPKGPVNAELGVFVDSYVPKVKTSRKNTGPIIILLNPGQPCPGGIKSKNIEYRYRDSTKSAERPEIRRANTSTAGDSTQARGAQKQQAPKTRNPLDSRPPWR